MSTFHQLVSTLACLSDSVDRYVGRGVACMYIYTDRNRCQNFGLVVVCGACGFDCSGSLGLEKHSYLTALKDWLCFGPPEPDSYSFMRVSV